MAQDVTISNQEDLSAAMMIRRALFLVLLIGLTFFYLALDFRGLNSPQGMDQAQIAREIARGNNFTTKMIRPLSLKQVELAHPVEDGEKQAVSLMGFQDIYHAPLNPLLNSLLLKPFSDSFEYDGESSIYILDQVIAAGSMVLLLCSIGVSYLLISRIFDQKIGGVTALLLLLCETLWKFSQTGLPQMLMLFLFSFAMYFFYKAIENHNAGKPVYLWIALTGGFFGLLALAHWITIWVFVGLLIFSAVYFKPRGVMPAIMFGIFLVIVSMWGVRNAKLSGSIAGSGTYMFYAGMGGESEGTIMRNYNPNEDPPVFDGFLRKVVVNTLPQMEKVYNYLGAIIAAPLFFLSLLHPFKRPEIAHFRWCILLMWIFAAIGMSLFGIDDGLFDSNQLNILFIPLMTGYGLAFLSVLWARLSLPVQIPMIRNGHLILAVLISAAPLLFTLPWAIRSGITIGSESNLKMNYPYFPQVFHAAAEGVDKEKGVIASDAPWAIAWYTDRVSVWLPKTESQFEEIAKVTEDRGSPIERIIFTPLATHAKFGSEILAGPWSAYKEEILQGTREIWGDSDKFIFNRFGPPRAVGKGAITIYSTSAL
ncbi:MAG: hypothetical protein ACI9R3_003837 [Verrucomicrobiales bacterium]|jgi:hypothetical protein